MTTNIRDARFANLELDIDPTPKTKTVVKDGIATAIAGPELAVERIACENDIITPASETAAAHGSRGVSQEGAERAKADEKAAEAAGFSLEAPVYEIGSLVNQWGVDNFRSSRSAFDAMPSATQACDNLMDRIAAEQRQDIVVPATSLKMLEDGRITRGGGKMPITERALLGLASFVTPGGGNYLKNCPPELRALNMNHWLERAERVDRRASKNGRTVMTDREVTLRTRKNHTSGKRENFATVGPRYTAFDIDKVAEEVMLADAIPADAKADIVYDGYKARIDVLFHTDIQPEKAVAGEIFKAGIIVKTADDGTGAIQIGAQVWRNLCLNLIIIDHDVLSVARRRHVGKVADIQATVAQGIEAAMAKVQHFADAWSGATLENVLEKYGCADVEAVMRGLVANKVVHVPHVSPADMHERLMNAWRAEPGYCRSDIVNAVTRAAHTESWRKWTDVEDLERTGGELLFAKVWNVGLGEGVNQESLGY